MFKVGGFFAAFKSFRLACTLCVDGVGVGWGRIYDGDGVVC